MWGLQGQVHSAPGDRQGASWPSQPWSQLCRCDSRRLPLSRPRDAGRAPTCDQPGPKGSGSAASEQGAHEHRTLGSQKGHPLLPEISLATEGPGNLTEGHKINPCWTTERAEWALSPLPGP